MRRVLTIGWVGPSPFGFCHGATEVDLPPGSSPVAAAAHAGAIDIVVLGPSAVLPVSEVISAIHPAAVFRVVSPAWQAFPVAPLGGLSHRYSTSLDSESFGSLACTRHLVECWSDVDHALLRPPVRTHGPAASRPGEPPILWPVEAYRSLGSDVELSAPKVLRAILDGVQGKGPLLVQPGFPFAISRHPLDLGTGATGLLCVPLPPDTRWRVLSIADVASLLGYPTRNAPWSWLELSSIVPVAFAAALLRSIEAPAPHL